MGGVQFREREEVESHEREHWGSISLVQQTTISSARSGDQGSNIQLCSAYQQENKMASHALPRLPYQEHHYTHTHTRKLSLYISVPFR